MASIMACQQNYLKKIPTLIKIEFSLDNKTYNWIINPNIDYAVEN